MRTSTAIPILAPDEDPPSGPYAIVARAVTQIRVSAPGRNTGVLDVPTMATQMVADAAPDFGGEPTIEELKADLARERGIRSQLTSQVEVLGAQLEIERGVAAAAVKQIGCFKLQLRAAVGAVGSLTSQLKAARARWHEVAALVGETLEDDR